MGCAVSKLEGEDLRPGLYSIQRKIMEVKRPPRRGRRLSIVSTTELLRSSSDADGEHGVEKLAAAAELPKVDPEEEEEKGRRLWQRVAEDEQLPGSPSFRFYFAGSTDADESDDGSVIFQKEETEKHKQTVDGSKQNQPSSSISKDSDTDLPTPCSWKSLLSRLARQLDSPVRSAYLIEPRWLRFWFMNNHLVVIGVVNI